MVIAALTLVAATSCSTTSEDDASKANGNEVDERDAPRAADSEEADDEGEGGEADDDESSTDGTTGNRNFDDDSVDSDDENSNGDETVDDETDDAPPSITDDGYTEEGVRDPNVEVEPDEASSSGVEARDSTLQLDERGDVRWYFTVENTTDESICSSWVNLELYDANDNLLAGNDPEQLLPEDGAAIFAATFTGSPHRRDDGAFRSCIGPGERGLGQGSTVSSATDAPSGFELLEQAARIEYFFGRRVEGFEPAPGAFVITSAELTQTDEGVAIKGEASSELALSGWTVYAALYDDAGKLLEVISTSGGELAEDEGVSFELPTDNPDATGFELYRDVQRVATR